MKKLAKTLNKVFTDKAFMEDMSKNCIGMHQIMLIIFMKKKLFTAKLLLNLGLHTMITNIF